MTQPWNRSLTVLRTLLLLPSVTGGAAVALVETAGLRSARPLVFLAWLSVAPALLTRPGERLAVRLGLRFRPPTVAEQARLRPVLDQALRRCGESVDAVDLYVTRDVALNAYLAGHRSLALTRGLVDEVLAGRLPDALLHAVLLHELGHRACRHRRYALATGWLAAPGRPLIWLARLAVAVALRGRSPGRLRLVLALGVGLVALWRSVATGDGATFAVLAAVAFSLLVAPTLRAWVSRQDELAADSFAAHHGAALQLAEALMRMTPTQPGQHVPLARHPTVAARCQVLRTQRAGEALSDSPRP